MSRTFEKTFHARWGDMDFNGHMKNTAFLDVSGDVRMMYFSEHGFSMREFERLRIGPVILRDELEYYKELRLLEALRVTLLLAGVSADASRFVLRNEFFRDDGRVAARVTSHGGWLDLTARRLVAPPEELASLLGELERTPDYRDVENRRWAPEP
jgi:acyl-CoA thioester hydrolase